MGDWDRLGDALMAKQAREAKKRTWRLFLAAKLKSVARRLESPHQ